MALFLFPLKIQYISLLSKYRHNFVVYLILKQFSHSLTFLSSRYVRHGATPCDTMRQNWGKFCDNDI